MTIAENEIIKEWDYEKNGDMLPDSISLRSNKKVWWRCSRNHSWEAAINSRNRGSGCPYCDRMKN